MSNVIKDLEAVICERMKLPTKAVRRQLEIALFKNVVINEICDQIKFQINPNFHQEAKL